VVRPGVVFTASVVVVVADVLVYYVVTAINGSTESLSNAIPVAI
jgi:hypothetical protein